MLDCDSYEYLAFHLSLTGSGAFCQGCLIGLRLAVSTPADYASNSFMSAPIWFISKAVPGPGFFRKDVSAMLSLAVPAAIAAVRSDES